MTEAEFGTEIGTGLVNRDRYEGQGQLTGTGIVELTGKVDRERGRGRNSDRDKDNHIDSRQGQWQEQLTWTIYS